MNRIKRLLGVIGVMVIVATALTCSGCSSATTTREISYDYKRVNYFRTINYRLVSITPDNCANFSENLSVKLNSSTSYKYYSNIADIDTTHLTRIPMYQSPERIKLLLRLALIPSSQATKITEFLLELKELGLKTIYIGFVPNSEPNYDIIPNRDDIESLFHNVKHYIVIVDQDRHTCVIKF